MGSRDETSIGFSSLLIFGLLLLFNFYLDTHTKMVAPLVELTSELLARASSTSEVLTLNLTNLLILIVLKALIFGFGLFSVGGTARSADDSPSFSETDLQGGMCFMMHMAGDESKLNCIKKTACAEPTVAAQYATASKMMYKMFKLLNI